MYILNAGYVFSTFWSVFKHALDPVTIKKINILSGDGKKELSQIMDVKKLPNFLGGEVTEDLRSNPGIWQEEL